MQVQPKSTLQTLLPLATESAGVCVLAVGLAVSAGLGCRNGTPSDSDQQTAADTDKRVRWEYVDDFPVRLAVYETVFWEPRDTDSLRELLRTTALVRDKTVLEIGTGSGLVSLACLRAGAARVIATDINPAAVANATYNAQQLSVAERFEARLVPRDRRTAFSVIAPDEKFDLIISNPPWENETPRAMADHALYDEDFQLLDSLFAGAREHLRPGGQVLLAYGSVEAIRLVQQQAPRHHWRVTILDARPLDDLPPVFLPGMLLRLEVNDAEPPRT